MLRAPAARVLLVDEHRHRDGGGGVGRHRDGRGHVHGQPDDPGRAVVLLGDLRVDDVPRARDERAGPGPASVPQLSTEYVGPWQPRSAACESWAAGVASVTSAVETLPVRMPALLACSMRVGRISP